MNLYYLLLTAPLVCYWVWLGFYVHKLYDDSDKVWEGWAAYSALTFFLLWILAIYVIILAVGR